MTAIPLPLQNFPDKMETIQGCVDLIYQTVKHDLVIILIEQVNRSILDDRGQITIYEGKHMSIAEALQKFCTTLFGIQPMDYKHGAARCIIYLQAYKYQ